MTCTVLSAFTELGQSWGQSEGAGPWVSKSGSVDRLRGREAPVRGVGTGVVVMLVAVVV